VENLSNFREVVLDSMRSSFPLGFAEIYREICSKALADLEQNDLRWINGHTPEGWQNKKILRDLSVHLHTYQVSLGTFMSCGILGISGRDRDELVIAAQLHDVGKIKCNEPWLDGELTDGELTVLRRRHSWLSCLYLTRFSNLFPKNDPSYENIFSFIWRHHFPCEEADRERAKKTLVLHAFDAASARIFEARHRGEKMSVDDVRICQLREIVDNQPKKIQFVDYDCFERSYRRRVVDAVAQAANSMLELGWQEPLAQLTARAMSAKAGATV